jgi:hypothetical protein
MAQGSAPVTRIRGWFVIGYANGDHVVYRDGEVVYQADQVLFVGHDYAGELDRSIDVGDAIVGPGFVDVNALADFMVVHRLVYEAVGNDVQTVVVDGRVVMDDRKPLMVDETSALDRAQEESAKLIERAGLQRHLHEPGWGRLRLEFDLPVPFDQRSTAVRSTSRLIERPGQLAASPVSSSMSTFCAPSHRTRLPSSRSCSRLSTMVAKWFPESCPALLLNMVGP